MTVIALIPGYNEEKTIEQVVKKVMEHVKDVLIVNDGSTDRTEEIIKKLNVKVITFRKNKGKAAAIKKGFEYCKNADAVITIDADLQHDTNLIPLLLEKLKNADIVITERDYEGMPLLRKLSNRFMALFVNLVCKTKFKDVQHGFRAFSNKAIQQIKIDSDGFMVETQMLIDASRKNLKIKSVKHPSIYFSDRKSKIQPVKETKNTIKFIIKILIKCLK